MADEQKTIVTKKAPVKPAATKKAAVKKSATKAAAPTNTAARPSTPAPGVRSTKKVAGKKTTPAPAAPSTVKPATRGPKPAADTAKSSATEHHPGKTRTRVVTPEERYFMIEQAAYFKAEQRNFDPAFDAENWAEAEREVDERLSKRQG
jgi:hypothetical protein